MPKPSWIARGHAGQVLERRANAFGIYRNARPRFLDTLQSCVYVLQYIQTMKLGVIPPYVMYVLSVLSAGSLIYS